MNRVGGNVFQAISKREEERKKEKECKKRNIFKTYFDDF